MSSRNTRERKGLCNRPPIEFDGTKTPTLLIEHMNRREISTGTTWEEKFGYSRAVKVGNMIRVAGTTAVEDGDVVGIDNAYEQTRHILKTIGDALDELEVGPEAVLSTTIYVKDFAEWEEIGQAHKEFFGEIRPATTLIEVSTMPNPDLLLEIEATAVANE